MSELKELKTAEYQDLVNQGGVTVVDFWAPWCGYCVRMMPIIEEIAGELEGKANFVKVNADEEPELARNMQVEVLPTFVILKDGEVNLGGVGRNRGKLKKNIIQIADKYLTENGKDNFVVSIGYGYDAIEGVAFKDEVEAGLGVKLNGDTNVEIGVITAVHTGPYAIGIGVIQKYETLK